MPGSTLSLTPICQLPSSTTGMQTYTVWYDNTDPAGLGTGVVWYQSDDYTAAITPDAYLAALGPGWSLLSVSPAGPPWGPPLTSYTFTYTHAIDACPEPPPAQCNQIDAVNIFGLPWGDVVLYPTVSGSRQPPFAATNQHGWDYP